MSNWSARYRERIRCHSSAAAYLQYKVAYKWPLIERIRQHAGPAGRVLETGCGAGTTTLYLASLGYVATGVDADPDMLALARELAAELGHEARFLFVDIRRLDFAERSFDVAFSNGVLEHFSDDDIRAILRSTTSVARTVVFAVPTDYYGASERLHGDEHFMSVSRWRRLIADADCAIDDEFAFMFPSPMHERVHRWSCGYVLKPPFIGFVVRRS